MSRNLTGRRPTANKANGELSRGERSRASLVRDLQVANVGSYYRGTNGVRVSYAAPLVRGIESIPTMPRSNYEKYKFALDRYMRKLIDRDPLTMPREKRMLKSIYARTKPIYDVSLHMKEMVNRLNLRHNIGGNKAYNTFVTQHLT